MADNEHTEVSPSPASLSRRIDAVTEMLNQLRNLIQGRGALPVGSQKLADRVNAAVEHWRDVRGHLTARELLTSPYDSSQAIEQYERLTNEIADSTVKEGLAGDAFHLPITHTLTGGELAEKAEHAIQATSDLVRGLIILGAGLGLIYVWKVRK